MSSKLLCVQWTVIMHPAVSEWLTTLDDDTYQQVIAAVRELRDEGPGRGQGRELGPVVQADDSARG